MKFKVGDTCKIIRNVSNHGLKIGSIAVVKSIDNGFLSVSSDTTNYSWTVIEEELELATPMEIASTLTTKKVDEQNDPFKQQVGGDHYKSMTIQPVEFILANGLGFCEGNVIKYICRYKQKGGVQDLKKVVHYAELLIKQLEDKK